MKFLLAALLLLASPAFATGTMARPSARQVKTYNASVYNNDVYFDVYGDTQMQFDPRTCGATPNPSTDQVNACVGATTSNEVLLGSSGGGWTPSDLDCSTGLECLDPNTGVNRCARSPYCQGSSWRDNGLAVIDAQIATSRGLQRASPFVATFVVQVGDLINQGNMAVTSAWTRADACPSSGTTEQVLTYQQNTNAINHLVQPLLDAGIALLVDQGNHDVLGCFETRIKPLLVGQPSFFASAVDGTHLDSSTNYSLKVRTAVGPMCLVSVGYTVYDTTATAAQGLIGCGATLPTTVSSHDGHIFTASFYWSGKPNKATTQIVDRTGHTEVWSSFRGHLQPNGWSLTPITGANTNSGATIFDLWADFQWSSYRGGGNSLFGGATYDGVSALDGSGGEIIRCRISPTRLTFTCVAYNPIARKYGPWDYASTGYVENSPSTLTVNGISNALDWCGRFGCSP